MRKTRRAKLDEDYVAAFIRANLYGSLTDSKNLITKDAKDDFPEFQKVNWFDEASWNGNLQNTIFLPEHNMSYFIRWTTVGVRLLVEFVVTIMENMLPISLYESCC